MIAQIFEYRNGKAIVLSSGPQVDQLFRMGYRQATKHLLVDRAKDRSIAGDSESNGYDRHCGKPRTAP